MPDAPAVIAPLTPTEIEATASSLYQQQNQHTACAVIEARAAVVMRERETLAYGPGTPADERARDARTRKVRASRSKDDSETDHRGGRLDRLSDVAIGGPGPLDWPVGYR
jgi:hypothetical protein